MYVHTYMYCMSYVMYMYIIYIHARTCTYMYVHNLHTRTCTSFAQKFGLGNLLNRLHLLNQDKPDKHSSTFWSLATLSTPQIC